MNHYNSIRQPFPIPVPIHMVTSPTFLPLLFNSGIIVASILAPLQPKGCPIAIAPPLTLTLFQSKLHLSIV